jgi:4-hydroxybenzoate polyprenyltransferase
VWLLSGRANLKYQLAKRAKINVAALPYRAEVMSFLEAERGAGRRLVLVTAADRDLARQVADYTGLFDQVLGSDRQRNLKGAAKAAVLRQAFGEDKFEYVGDSRADLKVWKLAHAAYVVSDEQLGRRAADVTHVRQVFAVKRPALATWVRALRGHHWSKNLLLFLPLALAHRFSLHALALTAVGFVLFGMCASGLYVLNDLLDLHSDRGHPWKRNRPFAAGEISIGEGLLIAFVLVVGSLGEGFLLDVGFGLALAGYAVLTMWYSLHLKKIVLLDAFVLSSFYCIRIFAGALITWVPLSHWFLAFSLFFFLSLAMAKRYSELVHAEGLVERGESGRGYLGRDREVLMGFGIASSFSAIVVFSLYVHSPEVLALYRSPEPLLLLAPIILYWLSRVWLKAHRGELHDDPITLALRDPASRGVAIACLVVIALSMLRIGR